MFETRFRQLIDGELDQEQSLAFLSSQRDQIWTGEELALAAQILRDRMTRVACSEPLLDTCGTGGDHQSTINISTAASLVLAACGVAVAKHGNRAVSSTSGSSDVLQVLGLPVDMEAGLVVKQLNTCSWAFCFAPRFHPRLKALAPLRKSLGFPTIFNYLGPLCNPCLVQYQILGVGKRALLDPMAQALARLNIKRAVVVHGEPGIDEVSLEGETHVRLIEGSTVSEHTWLPADFGLERSSLDDIRCHDATTSAAHLLQIFEGKTVPGTPWVLANAAAGLFVAGRVKSLSDGIHQAKEVVRSGSVMKTLQALQAFQTSHTAAS